MFLAEKTVKNYVSSLLAKLGLERRTQAAVFASKHLGRPACRGGPGPGGGRGRHPRSLDRTTPSHGGSSPTTTSSSCGPTPSAAVPAIDPDGRARHLSCGAALALARVAAAGPGVATSATVLPDPAEPEHLADLHLDGRGRTSTDADERALADAIGTSAHRARAVRRRAAPTTADEVAALADAVRREGCWLRVVDPGDDAAAVTVLLARRGRRAGAEPAYREELRRWTGRDADSPDGVPATAVPETPPADRGSSYRLRDFDARPRRQSPNWAAEPPPPEHPLVVVLGSPEDDVAGVAGGRPGPRPAAADGHRARAGRVTDDAGHGGRGHPRQAHQRAQPRRLPPGRPPGRPGPSRGDPGTREPPSGRRGPRRALTGVPGTATRHRSLTGPALGPVARGPPALCRSPADSRLLRCQEKHHIGGRRTGCQARENDMRRKTFDRLMAIGGLVLAVALLVAGSLLTWAHVFVSDQVKEQLTAQKIFFPPTGSDSLNDPAVKPYLSQYAGQQLTTGAQAEAYANHFIKVHLNEIGRWQDLRAAQ